MVWSLLLLAFASAVGFAALTALAPREPSLRRLLWAPAFGFGIVTLALFALSRAGAPVASVAVPLVAAGVLCFAAIVVWRRPRISLRRLAAFGAIVVVVYAANAVPLARLGTAWLGYVNGDMLFYCTGADDLMRHGTGDLPSGAELDARDELTRTSSTLYGFAGVREGSELLLAFASALERVHPDQAFMGLQIALIAALAAAVGGLIAGSARRRLAATVAGAAAGALPLVAYSAFNGLMPQLFGSALLGVAYAICGDRLFVVRRALGTAVAGGIATAALLVVYPEMAPFLFVALAVRAAFARRVPRALGIAAAAVVVVLNLYLPVAIGYSVAALSARGAVALAPRPGAAAAGPVAQAHFGFPYMLEPIGQANLWGFAALAPSPADPRTQIGIVLGLLASLAAIVLMVRRRREPVTVLVGVMSAVLFALILRSSDFGSFKAALYLEPFLAAFLATIGKRGLVAAVWVLAALPVQLYYVDRSYGDLEREGNHYVAVAGASSSRLPERLERDLHAAPAALLTSDDRAVRELAMLRGRGTAVFEAQGRRIPADFVNPLDHVRTTVDGVPVPPARYVAGVLVPRADSGPDQSISVGGRVADFRSAPEVGFAERRRGLRIVADDPDHTVLNRSRDGATPADMLVDMGSSLGNYGDHGLYPAERDPYRPGRTMSAAARYGVFAVLAPTARVRLRLDLASAFVGNGAAALPPARIITADGVLPLDITGGGSARVESPPFRPLERKHRAFVVLDFGIDPPKAPPEPRRGFWLLWGRNIAFDNRDVVTYVRDLTAVPDTRADAAPSALRRFPEDLADPALRFSGVYDDGWTSRDFHVALRRRAGDRVLRVRVDVPAAVRISRGTSNACVVTLDGKTVARFAAPPGSYDEQIVLTDAVTGARRVGLRFDRGIRLGPRDKREAAALVREIAFAAQ